MPEKRSPEAIKRRLANAKLKRELRIQESLCHCGQPNALGKTLCQSHLDKDREATKRYQQKPGVRERMYEYKKNDGRFSFISSLVRRQGKTWELSEEEWREIISNPCSYCELPNDVELMDRLDNSKGYIPGNVVSSCHICNIVRGNIFTPDEMKIIGKTIRQIKIDRQNKETASYNAEQALEHESAIVDGRQAGQNK